MDGSDNSQLDLLAQIHNQLVDLKKIIVEAESAKSDNQDLKDRLAQLIANDQHIDALGHSGATASHEQKVIAPNNTSITPGEDRELEIRGK